MIRRLLVTMVAAAAVTGFGAAAPAYAHCPIDLGTCGPQGHCTLNVSTCDGHCLVNGPAAYCGPNGGCPINFGFCG